MKNYALLLILFLAQHALGQNNTLKARADQAFEEKDYVTAAFYYDKSIAEGASASQGKVPYFSGKQKNGKAAVAFVQYRLAESWRLSKNYKLAEDYYRKIVENHEIEYPMARFWFGVCLRANNKLDEAIAELELFSTTNKANSEYLKKSTKELKDCRFALSQGKQSLTTSVEKLEDKFSTDENDFALNISNGQYWFTATTAVAGKKNLNQLFVSDRDSMAKKVAINFGSDPKLAVNYGPASLYPAGQRIYVTRWYREGADIISGIYLSKYVDQQWSAPQKLSSYVNADGYKAMQPFVTADGKRLYFVSNRAGGIGGMDIWMSDLNKDGLPLNAVNLGNTINTAEDENAPYFDRINQRLVYSSKGFVGMGDFDLYESTLTEKSWTAPKNLGIPYNSTKDDLHYYIDEDDKETVFVSSDRESECCLNLFKMHYTKPAIEAAILAGFVTDCATNQPLSGVSVVFTDLKTKKIREMVTDETGKYNFDIVLKRGYQIRLEKVGYFAKVLPVASRDTFRRDTVMNATICLDMLVLNKAIVIENILYDFNKAVLKPESKVVLDNLVAVLEDNPKIKIELSAHTDSMGPDWYNMKLSQQRAQSCVEYIISKGIDPTRILAKGYGESQPVQPNTLPNGKDNSEGRKLNRRTEFKVLSLQ